MMRSRGLPPRTWTYPDVCDALLSPAAAAGEAIVHVGTSGSTGSPKIARLTARALTASATSTLEVLGGPGQWLLATPATHIAGIQVLVRSAIAGIEPVTISEGPFTPESFAAAAGRVTHGRRYTALVPTQVRQLLAEPAGRDALASFDTVLVGGAAVPKSVRELAADAGAHIVATYGMSETAGGCVYDGVPLPVTTMRIADPDEDGVGIVELGGATLADGYVPAQPPSLTPPSCISQLRDKRGTQDPHDPGDPNASFFADPDGRRWFRTDDLGRTTNNTPTGAPVLEVLGRRDDVINTGGLKVAPHVVEEAIARAFPDLDAHSIVIATRHDTWGEAVTLVTAHPSPPALDEIRETLRAYLPAAARPTRMVSVQEIPMLGPGKPDRRRLRAQLSRGN